MSNDADGLAAEVGVFLPAVGAEDDEFTGAGTRLAVGAENVDLSCAGAAVALAVVEKYDIEALPVAALGCDGFPSAVDVGASGITVDGELKCAAAGEGSFERGPPHVLGLPPEEAVLPEGAVHFRLNSEIVAAPRITCWADEEFDATSSFSDGVSGLVLPSGAVAMTRSARKRAAKVRARAAAAADRDFLAAEAAASVDMVKSAARGNRVKSFADLFTTAPDAAVMGKANAKGKGKDKGSRPRPLPPEHDQQVRIASLCREVVSLTARYRCDRTRRKLARELGSDSGALCVAQAVLDDELDACDMFKLWMASPAKTFRALGGLVEACTG
jgi:hypothetical protein